MREKIAIALANWGGWDFPDLAPTDALATGSEPSQEAYYELADQIHKEYMAWFLSKLKPLSGEEIGDALDSDVEATYPRSDGSSIMTIFVNKLLEAQLDAVKKELEGK